MRESLPADPALLTEFVEWLTWREQYESASRPERKAQKAQVHLMLGLNLFARLCGKDLLDEALGPQPRTQEEILRAAAERLEIFADAFEGTTHGSAIFSTIAAEARAVLQGDRPQVFATIGRAQPIRLLQCKFLALRWDAWLEGLGVPAPERHAAIGTAFAAEWETIRRRWRADVFARWGEREMGNVLESDRRDGGNNRRMWHMRPGVPWEDDLKLAGESYKSELRTEK